MQDKQVQGIARMIAVPLLFAQDGPMDDPETWARVAARRGHECEYFHDAGAGPGEWVSCEAGTGCVRVNTFFPPCVQARVSVHEIAHAEMSALASGLWRGDAPGFLRGCFTICPPAARMGYDDDPDDARHRIARRVEQICFRRNER